MKEHLGVYKLHENVILPKKETEGAACFDLRLCLDHVNLVTYHDNSNKKIKVPFDRSRNVIVLAAGERCLAPTGIIFDIPDGFSLRLHSRSSLSWKRGLILTNSEGIIDSDYVEETFVMLHNTGSRATQISNGDRICQAELVRNQNVSISEIVEKPERTTRNGGFGSTGK